jgi:archaemetzincin
MRSIAILLLCLVTANCGGPGLPAANTAAGPVPDERAAELIGKKEVLARFFRPMHVREGDWLEEHPENGETFEEYVRSGPMLPTETRGTIYIQPVGDFSKAELNAIGRTADYMKAFFNLPVVRREALALGDVPGDLVRVRYPDNMQVRTSYFLDHLLPKLLPDDAAALICLTSYDLYPGDTWNYVFGQASLEKRVGVWSLWRLGRDNGKPASADLLLARTVKIAMHETGHMFSMRHCTKYECLMSGTNHLDETDRRPLDACPECAAKISWAMRYPLADRYKNLAAFWKRSGRVTEEREMLDKAGALCTCKVEVP